MNKTDKLLKEYGFLFWVLIGLVLLPLFSFINEERSLALDCSQAVANLYTKGSSWSHFNEVAQNYTNHYKKLNGIPYCVVPGYLTGKAWDMRQENWDFTMLRENGFWD